MESVQEPVPGRPYAVISGDGKMGLADVDEAQVVALYKRHGALLFRGFDADLAAFSTFAKSYCSTSMINESPNRALLDPVTNIQSVDLGDEPFPLHPELAREPWKPDVCMFACMAPPNEGGETTICDGVALVEGLSAEVREGLAARRLLYVAPAGPQLLQYWLGTQHPSAAQLAAPPAHCPYSFTVHSGRIARSFTRPALHTPMFTDAPAFGNFLLFARYVFKNPNFPAFADGTQVPPAWTEEAKEVGDRLTAAIQWQRGDVLMLDNTRFMHGRRAILDPGQRQIASYFGYLKFALPNPEEPADPVWRRSDFRPPQPPANRRPRHAHAAGGQR